MPYLFISMFYNLRITQVVLKEESGWLVELPFLRDVWRSVSIMNGELFAMKHGT